MRGTEMNPFLSAIGGTHSAPASPLAPGASTGRPDAGSAKALGAAPVFRIVDPALVEARTGAGQPAERPAADTANRADLPTGLRSAFDAFCLASTRQNNPQGLTRALAQADGVNLLNDEEVKQVLADMGLPTSLADQITMVEIPPAKPGDRASVGILMLPETAEALGLDAGHMIVARVAPDRAAASANATDKATMGPATGQAAKTARTDAAADATRSDTARAEAREAHGQVGRTPEPLAGAGTGAASDSKLTFLGSLIVSAAGRGDAGHGAAFAGTSPAGAGIADLTATGSGGALLSGSDAQALRIGLDGLTAGGGDAALKRLLGGGDPLGQAQTAAQTAGASGEADAQRLRQTIADLMFTPPRPVVRAVPTQGGQTGGQAGGQGYGQGQGAAVRSLTGAVQGDGAQGAQSITGMTAQQAQAGAGVLNALARGGTPARYDRQGGRAPASDQTAVQVQRAVAEGQTRFTVQLQPAELGRVAVRLEFDQGRVRANVTADRRETLDLLQRDARSLERALQDAGLETNGDSLEFTLSDDANTALETALGRRENRAGWPGPGSAARQNGADADPMTGHVIDVRDFIDPRIANGVDITV
ncbi:flagellar hook-length control protein FliK [Rhodothalassium salexigens]|uniref:flagellar hook-length control protein FliK n=1 Tax=Rhodothalassium salexigens TaxID=1086 RepID=UPI001911E7B2|nr:flagellar hook-length control protein FliK [Rhodothalassium salexigens]